MKYKQSKYNIWKSSTDSYLLLNTFTKSLARITASNYEKIQNLSSAHDNCGLEEHIISNLSNNGFIIPQSINEVQLLRYKYRQSYFSSNYLFVTLLLTLKCNFKCPYCFETEKRMRFKSTEIGILKKFSRIAFKAKKKVHISLFGGEPLLEVDNIYKYMRYVNRLKDDYGFYYDSSIATNGYFLSRDIIDSLADEFNCKTFQVTIDGDENTHNRTRTVKNNNSYNRVLRNFKLLLEKATQKNGDLHIKLRVNLLNNSVEDISTLLAEFSKEEKELFYIYFRPVYNTTKFCVENQNKNNLEEFYLLAKRNGFRVDMNRSVKYNYCEGDSGLNQIQIMPDLSVWKCINDLSCSTAKIGNIHSDGSVNLDYKHLEIWSRNDPFDDANCIECQLLPICYGGCPLSYKKHGKRSCMYEKDFDLFGLFGEK